MCTVTITENDGITYTSDDVVWKEYITNQRIQNKLSCRDTLFIHEGLLYEKILDKLDDRLDELVDDTLDEIIDESIKECKD
ncbi:MAG: hypothetical protein MJZ34_13910 [Paludibacteraceae bacterium]|nr:hypothetical protein [Paludibacteraceae bacterium]